MTIDNGAASAALYARARRVMPGGSTRAAVWMEPYPPYVARGEGPCVYDVDGTEYLDLTNNLGVLIHGHAHPEVVAAVRDQAGLGSCFALPTGSEVALAELLCERVTGFERIRFINTGSEAVGLALKIARSFTGRPKIVKLEGVYHGSNEFAEISNYSRPENWGNSPASVATVRGTPQGVLDNVIAVPANDLEAIESVLDHQGSDIAAVLLDPVPPRAGMRPLDPDYVAGVRVLTRKLGILLVYDEVIAFRFGYGGAQTRFGGEPDLTALGKIIGGGYPVGAVAGSAEVMEATAKDVGSSGTFTANPITMRAGHASMSLLTHERYDELDALGERMMVAANDLIREAGVDGQVVGTGSIASVYFHDREVRDYRSYYKQPSEVQTSDAFHRAMLDRGVLIAPTATCFFSTVFGGAEEDRFLSAFRQSLGHLRG